MKANKTFGLVVFAAQVQSVTKDIKKSCGTGTATLSVNVCLISEDELTITEHIDTFMSNPKAKQITLKSANNFFDFPQDFIFNAQTQRKYDIPNAEKIIQDMKDVKKNIINLFSRLTTLKKRLLKDCLKKRYQTFTLIWGNPVRITSPYLRRPATLSALLDCDKYNGNAGILGKIVLSIVSFALGGGAGSLMLNSVEGGMNLHNEIKDLKMRS